MSLKLSIPTTINVHAKDAPEAQRRAVLLETLNKNLDFDVLEILASKSGTVGVNIKVRTFKNLL